MRIIREKTARKLMDLLVMDDVFMATAPFASQVDLQKILDDKHDVIKEIYGPLGLLEYIDRSLEAVKPIREFAERMIEESDDGNGRRPSDCSDGDKEVSEGV